MLRRGDVDIQDMSVELNSPRKSLTFDGLCLEFNPERLPYLNAAALVRLQAKGEVSGDCEEEHCEGEDFEAGEYEEEHYEEIEYAGECLPLMDMSLPTMTAQQVQQAWEAWHAADSCRELETNASDVLPPGCTTVMLRNIPNKYTQALLAERLHSDGYWGMMDFLYLPMDFRQKVNAGYAFISFRTAEAAVRFTADYHLARCLDKLPGFNSQKICEVAPARFQGRTANIERLRSSSVMSRLTQTPDWLPMLFDEVGQVEPFPLSSDSTYA